MGGCDNKFYDILGVSPDASQEDIKRAYRKLAVKLHPDKPTGDAEKFKELSKAYKTLSDPDARAKYDSGGEGALGSDFFGDGQDLSSVFSSMFGGMFGGSFGGRQKPQKGSDISHTANVTLEEVYKGVTKTYRIKREVLCGKCGGTGSKSGKTAKCQTCRGQGQVNELSQIGGSLMMQNVVTCRTCKGSGKSLRKDDVCGACNFGKVIAKEDVTMDVLPGTPDGKSFVFEQKGNEEEGIAPGDLVITVNTLPHSTFQRFNSDLIMTKTISLEEALHGVIFEIPSLKSKNEKIAVSFGQTVIKPGEFRKVAGLGLPNIRNKNFGDLFVKFDVHFPTWSEANYQTGKEEMFFEKLALAKKSFNVVAEAGLKVLSEEDVAEVIESKKERKKNSRSSFFSFF